MKNFAMLGIVALVAGFYALGSTNVNHSVKTDQLEICNANVLDTVPKKKDTLNKRDTTGRKDSLQRPDLEK
jgi:hypothetical protein